MLSAVNVMHMAGLPLPASHSDAVSVQNVLEMTMLCNQSRFLVMSLATADALSRARAVLFFGIPSEEINAIAIPYILCEITR